MVPGQGYGATSVTSRTVNESAPGLFPLLTESYGGAKSSSQGCPVYSLHMKGASPVRTRFCAIGFL